MPYRAGIEGIAHSAAQVGVRETRRIVGEYVLTQDDLMAGRTFSDTIACGTYPMDIPSPTDGGGGVSNRGETANIYEIPYRCLVPLTVEQLLVAGRCVSATHESPRAIRVMPTSFAMGEAAGTAAALASAEGIAPRQVPVPWVRETLMCHGAYLGPASPYVLPVSGGDGPPKSELIARDKANLDVFWLRDESIEEGAKLPAPELSQTNKTYPNSH